MTHPISQPPEPKGPLNTPSVTEPNPLFAASPVTSDGAPTGAPAPRSIWDRMTNPTASDLKAGDGLKSLGRSHVDMVVNAFITYLDQHRDDITVKPFQDGLGHGWTIRILNAESPLHTSASGGESGDSPSVADQTLPRPVD